MPWRIKKVKLTKKLNSQNFLCFFFFPFFLIFAQNIQSHSQEEDWRTVEVNETFTEQV